MRPFLINLCIFSVLVGAADFSYQYFVGTMPGTWLILAFFITTTTAFHMITMNAAKGKPQQFIRYYMGSTALRLLIYILVIVAYRFKAGKEATIPFAIVFMVHYILFTIFEVIMLLRFLKGKN